MGQGTYGTVVKAIHKKTQQKVAIKLIDNIKKDSYRLRQTLRELIILRKLSEVDKNIFTTKLIDVIIPSDCLIPSKEEGQSSMYDLNKLNYLFIVMEL